MSKTYLSLAAAGILLSTAALAQDAETSKHDNTGAQQTATSPSTTTADASSSTTKTTGLRQEMKQSLQKAGFSNVRVVPDSFLVQAKDRNGNPVAMIINPHSMTEVVDEGPVGQTADNDTASDVNGTGTGTTGTGMASAEGSTFTTVPSQAKLSSTVVGLNVYNDKNQDIGTIKDIAYGRNGVKAYILGVGGFLGMGDHYVAVEPSAVKLNYDSNNKTWRAQVDATADQLKSAPAYTYPNQG